MTIFKTYEITVDTIERKEYTVQESEMQTVRFSQNDQNSAKLVLNITQKGVVQDLSAATAVRIAFKKADGKLVYQDCQSVNALTGKYQVVLNTQTLAAMGKVVVQVQIEFTDRQVETQKFAFVVDESLMSDETIESTNEFGIIQKAIEAGEKFEGKDIDGIIAAGAKADTANAQIAVLQGINENTFSYTYKADGSVDVITEKDKNNTVISTTAFKYLANGDVDTSAKTMNGVTVTTKYNYDTNGNLTGTVNTKS